MEALEQAEKMRDSVTMEEGNENPSVEVSISPESEVKVPSEVSHCRSPLQDIFKKPQLIIGPRRGKVIGKVRSIDNKPQEEPTVTEVTGNIPLTDSNISDDSEADPSTVINSETKISGAVSPAEMIKESSLPLPYKEPKWSGIPNEIYSFEVLKSGKILENVSLNSKPFYVFGRLSTCDIHMAHPTISRHHAVLQYRSQESENNPIGFYIYDLGSTHGTFLNKNRIKSNMFVRVQVGHILKLGLSTRLFLLQGPEEDMEEESELTVTQLKEKRQLELAAKELEELEYQRQEEERLKLEEEQGIDWGMGDDANEETDLAENPFAATQNEDLYINDPKKTLRGWFEREGYELEYDVEEKGFGQFLCRVELPIENARGSTMIAEALVKGKKKEAVIQCALEACRLLDRYGLLRQATHESKKRKAKDWEAEDYYDSDEDTFLDRTGTVEKKRQQRMRAAGKKDPGEVVETYDSLVKKHNEILSQLRDLEIQLKTASATVNKSPFEQHKNDGDGDDDEDALDAFMMKLSAPEFDRKLVSRIKSQLTALKQEEIRLRNLVNIVRPANLPELCPPEKTDLSINLSVTCKKAVPLIGTRWKPVNKKKQFQMECTEAVSDSSTLKAEQEQEEEEEEEEEEESEEIRQESGKSPGSHVEQETKASGHNEEAEEPNGTEHKDKGYKMETDILQIESPKKLHTLNQKTKVFGPTMPPTLKENCETTSHIDKMELTQPQSDDDDERKKERKKNRNKRRIQKRHKK
ncbi:hypothetical protein B7P43_G02964, partial [Cryptotermes secundus]